MDSTITCAHFAFQARFYTPKASLIGYNLILNAHYPITLLTYLHLSKQILPSQSSVMRISISAARSAPIPAAPAAGMSAMRVSMSMGMAIIIRSGMAMAVRVSPRRRKRPEAGVAEVLNHGLDGVEGIAVLPVRARLAPGSPDAAAEVESLGHLVAHDVLYRMKRGGRGC